jgi:RNA polymerase sigma-70 factor (sigma-E family)
VNWSIGKVSRREFDRFAAQVTDQLLRTAFLMTWNLEDSEDLVQEALIRVARRWDRVREMEYPSAYARRILVNLVIDGTKKRVRRNTELEEHTEDLANLGDLHAASQFGAIDSFSEFGNAMAKITRRQRAVIVLRYWEDMSEADIALLLGCSVGNVKSSASRGLSHLRRILVDHQGHHSNVTDDVEERTVCSC